jgi:hypothetical protein
MMRTEYSPLCVDYWRDLGKKALKTPGFRFMPGMLDLRRWRHVGERPRLGSGSVVRLASASEFTLGMSGIPDLSDPATVGALKALVLDKHKPARLTVDYVENAESEWLAKMVFSRPEFYVTVHGKSEAEALLALLAHNRDGTIDP